MAGQRDGPGKDVQQLWVIKDRDRKHTNKLGECAEKIEQVLRGADE